MSVRRALRPIAFACTVAVFVAGGPAHAHWWVYGSLDFGYSIGESEVSGSTVDFGDFSGSDQDVSPVLGGSVGLEMPLNEFIPWAGTVEWLKWPAWPLRIELEGAFLREYELSTDGVAAPGPTSFPFNTKARSWSVMTNFWLELPLAGLHKPIAATSGFLFQHPKLPRLKQFLKPTSMYLGLGIGFADFKVKTSDAAYMGSTNDYEFAYQFGVGAGYQLTERVNLSAGYRYHRVRTEKFDIAAGGLAGNFRLRSDIHEARFSLRIRFKNFPSLWH